MEDKTLIKQGAEARVYQCKFLGRETIVKERFSKKYRHPILDQKINQKRLTQEAKNTVKARQLGVETPALYHVNSETNEIYMEYVSGCTVKQFLLGTNDAMLEQQLAEKIGEDIAILHDGKIIHGDLTTSNMLLRNSDPQQLVLIDFGLSYISTLAEDKAVDLYVLERAMLSTHPNSEKLFEHLLIGYQRKSGKQSPQVMAKLDQVRQRGRKRSMIG